MDAVMLTINDLKDKLRWEDTDDMLDLLNVSTEELLEYLNDEIETHQDKLREHYEIAEELDWQKESNQS